MNPDKYHNINICELRVIFLVTISVTYNPPERFTGAILTVRVSAAGGGCPEPSSEAGT